MIFIQIELWSWRVDFRKVLYDGTNFWRISVEPKISPHQGLISAATFKLFQRWRFLSTQVLNHLKISC